MVIADVKERLKPAGVGVQERSRRFNPARVYLGVGAAALAVYFLVLPNERANQIAYLPFGWAAATAAFWTARKRIREGQWFLVLIGAGVVSFAVGDAIYASYRVVRNVAPPYPSPGDFGWLGAYVFWTAALFTLVRRRTSGNSLAAWTDAAIIVVGTGLVSWTLMISPVLGIDGASFMVKAVSIAYPVADIVMIGLAARLIVTGGARTPAFRLLLGAFIALTASDVVYGLYIQNATYHRGNLIDLGWLGAYVLFGALSFEPTTRDLSKVQPSAHGVSRKRLLALALATLIAPVMSLHAGDGGTSDQLVPATVSGVLFLLVLGRMSGLIRVLNVSLERLDEAQYQRGRLFERSVRATEDERTRLAAELHDGPVQRMTVLGLRLERALALLRSRRGKEATGIVAAVRDTISDEIGGLRRMMTELRPPVLDERGLEAALRDHTQTVARKTGLACRVKVDIEQRPTEAIETVLYRVSQEALTNVIKHANASAVEIALRTRNGHVQLVVRDDGAGFEVPDAKVLARQGRFGLLSMRERVEMAGGRWHVTSTPGGGTTIAVVMPRTEVAA